MLSSITLISSIKKAKIKLAFFLSHSFSLGNSNIKIDLLSVIFSLFSYKVKLPITLLTSFSCLGC